MTVTADMIPMVSLYKVVSAGPFTPALFSLYSSVAKQRLDVMNPGLDGSTYDYCHALLICHLYAGLKDDGLDLKSETIGNYSYTKSTEAGESTFLIRCREIITEFQGGDIPNEAIDLRDE